jgi:hypothetical protein
MFIEGAAFQPQSSKGGRSRLESRSHRCLPEDAAAPHNMVFRNRRNLDSIAWNSSKQERFLNHASARTLCDPFETRLGVDS